MEVSLQHCTRCKQLLGDRQGDKVVCFTDISQGDYRTYLYHDYCMSVERLRTIDELGVSKDTKNFFRFIREREKMNFCHCCLQYGGTILTNGCSLCVIQPVNNPTIIGKITYIPTEDITLRVKIEVEKRLRDQTCPQCKKQFRLTWNDYTREDGQYIKQALKISSCPSGGVYNVSIECPHCDYSEDL